MNSRPHLKEIVVKSDETQKASELLALEVNWEEHEPSFLSIVYQLVTSQGLNMVTELVTE